MARKPMNGKHFFCSCARSIQPDDEGQYIIRTHKRIGLPLQELLFEQTRFQDCSISLFPISFMGLSFTHSPLLITVRVVFPVHMLFPVPTL